MAVFDRSKPPGPLQLDWGILLNGAISLFVKHDSLEEACQWFFEHQYQLYRFDCTDWKSERDFFDIVYSVLNLPAYCGRNLDAFDDCLIDLDVPYEGGAVLVFFRFDKFAGRCPEFAQDVLDTIEKTSRKFLLTGLRLIALVQSNDRHISFQSVGACAIVLNPWEFRDSIRETRFENPLT